MSSDSQSPLPGSPATPSLPHDSNPAEVIPIGDLVVRQDYPQCMVGQTVDIRGIVGVVIQLSGQSLKIRQAEGRTQSFNVHVLRKLYGPPVRHEPVASEPVPRSEPASSDAPETSRSAAPEPEPEPEPAKPARLVIANPDFSAPLVSIAALLQQADFPRCALGVHVDIGGQTGVVVEVTHQSLRVQSPEGQRRSYNGPALRKLYAGR